MSDDLRMHSGIATVSKDIVLETIHHYDWVQIGGAIKHPDNGKIIDMSDAVRNETNVSKWIGRRGHAGPIHDNKFLRTCSRPTSSVKSR